MSGKKIIVVFAIFLASLFFLNKDICIASEKEQGDSEEILINFWKIRICQIYKKF